MQLSEVRFDKRPLSSFSKRIHQLAKECAREYLKAESRLLDVIIQIDKDQTFKHFGYTHLTPYCVHELGLSEETAGAFVRVARKSVEVPELKRAVEDGLSVSKAKTIASVLTCENHEEWIEKAETLSRNKIEVEIARVNPTPVTVERVKVVGENRHRFTFELDDEHLEMFRRVTDLLSQRLGRPASIVDVQVAMMDCYLEKNDPVCKAERAIRRKAKKEAAELSNAKQDCTDMAKSNEFENVSQNGRPRGRSSIPSTVRHAVWFRDNGKCQARHADGSVCGSSRWVHLHHMIEVSRGGQNTPENIITLCSSHHRLWHERHSSLSM